MSHSLPMLGQRAQLHRYASVLYLPTDIPPLFANRHFFALTLFRAWSVRPGGTGNVYHRILRQPEP
jgi:hypothetical protein